MSDEARWCCVCGEVDPPGLEVCPASGLELTHLIAYGKHARAMKIYNGKLAVEGRRRAREQIKEQA